MWDAHLSISVRIKIIVIIIIIIAQNGSEFLSVKRIIDYQQRKLRKIRSFVRNRSTQTPHEVHWSPTWTRVALPDHNKHHALENHPIRFCCKLPHGHSSICPKRSKNTVYNLIQKLDDMVRLSIIFVFYLNT